MSPLPPWAVMLLLITVKDLGINLPGVKWAQGSAHRVNGLPLPADYMATFLIFAPLAVLGDSSSQSARTLAGVTGWAWVLASLLSAIDPTDPLNKASSSKTLAGSTLV